MSMMSSRSACSIRTRAPPHRWPRPTRVITTSLKNQLSFVNAGMSFKTYTDAADFAACYPFAAYQFTLVQKVFESIRKAGATGLHLSQGERSTLDAFQSAAKQIGAEEIGALVPVYSV